VAEETKPKRTRPIVAMGGAKETIAILAEGQLLASRYRIVEMVGSGGMGVVYKAQDEKLDGRVFALKTLPPDMAQNEASVKRLKKEALAAIELHHPHIMALHSFDSDGPHTFLVLEFLDGPNLESELADRDRLPLEEVLDVARQVSPALDYAHGQGIVHRDIKPANLLSKTHDGQRIVKIGDFGIAYSVRNSMARITGQDVGGTMCYMPPEQLAGRTVDARADQYALAATLYELLRGRPPFEGGGGALIHQIKSETPEPIEDVPAHVNAALQKALAKTPDERFASCGELLAALDAAAPVEASVRPIVEEPPSPTVEVPPTFVEDSPPPVEEKDDSQVTFVAPSISVGIPSSSEAMSPSAPSDGIGSQVGFALCVVLVVVVVLTVFAPTRAAPPHPRKARLTVVVDPPDADIFLGNESLGKGKLTNVELWPCKDVVTATRGGDVNAHASVDLVAGKSRTIELKLKRR